MAPFDYRGRCWEVPKFLFFLLSLISLLLLFNAFAASAQTSTTFNMQVYADGSTAIVQSIAVNSSDVSITVPLLSPIITNVLATDQNGSQLSFQISGGNITVYTMGATNAIIQYDTDLLTSKQGSVWSLSFATFYNLTVTLPPHSSLISVSGTPTSLFEENGSPVVVVSPGNWTMKYGVPIEASMTTSSAISNTSMVSQSSLTTSSQQTTTTSQSSESKISPTGNGQLSEYGGVGVVVTLAVVGAYLFFRRRNGIIDARNSELRQDDIQVIDYIAEKGGKVFEQEIRARFTLPKTSAWRQIKRLERLGYVKVYKVGSQNQIELLKKRE
ncbi:MAG: hypothetical protein M1368_09715 [Thaumarchaeota archaeon]|nr:hypothetical protein [Nitrososphaerota archaeon]